MKNLKLTSIRVSVDALDSAHYLAKQFGCYNPSDVLRLAMWIGLKIVTPECASVLNSLMLREEAGLRSVTAKDVLRAAEYLKDDESTGAL